MGEAVAWCKIWGLEFDAVNANLPERIAEYKNDCQKVNADKYWDDRAVIARKRLILGTGQEGRRGKILSDAVRIWGRDAQMFMMVEEMSELTKEICKFYRATDDTRAAAAGNVQEEMADVQIMFRDVENMMQAKMNRLEKRLEAAPKKKEAGEDAEG